MTSKIRLGAAFACAVSAIAFLPGLAAGSVTSGSTFSVASQTGIPATGTHFHSDDSGSLSNPPDKAEVGSLIGQLGLMEECRGLSEFDLTGLSPGTATLSFNVFKLGGLFAGQNDYPFTGNIAVLGYAGNNIDEVPDYSAAVASAGTFSTASLSLGMTLNINVTALYNAQLSGGSPALGIRLQTTPSTVTGGGAFTFDTFMLTVAPVAEPEPGAIGLLTVGAIVMLTRRKMRCGPAACGQTPRGK